MKTIKVKREIEEEWEHTRWLGWVNVVAPSGSPVTLTHERDIPESWPDEIKKEVRAEIQAHRDLADCEIRVGEQLGAMRVIKSGLSIKWPKYIQRLTRDQIFSAFDRDNEKRALAYLDRHSLADNEALTHGTRKVEFEGRVTEFTHSGKLSILRRGSAWPESLTWGPHVSKNVRVTIEPIEGAK